ncbi:hypothetical protein ACFQHO_11150 [Actinomadura yumaensis]|uniref:hypothetical protein n=1 Tax=Actinomadura yumaensis TaxID=111807 RepID=UPI00361DFF03
MNLDSRLRAVCALTVPTSRQDAGLHEYDGAVQDLSLDAVRRGLAVLGAGPRRTDPFEEAYLAAAEEALRVRFGELELHRVDPSLHIDVLDPSCYERDYAPERERAEARRTHVRAWPDAVDAAIATLDRVPRRGRGPPSPRPAGWPGTPRTSPPRRPRCAGSSSTWSRRPGRAGTSRRRCSARGG